MIAQVADQCASVDIPEDRYLELFQVFFRNLLRAPVGAHARKLADDQALNIRACGFVIFGVRAVIADFRISENDDLAGIGRIGKDFLIAGDGSIKNYFPVTFAFGAVAFASEDSAVFQRKDCLHSRSGQWILTILAGNCCQAGTFFIEKKFVLSLRRIAFESRDRRVFSLPA